MPPVTIGKWHLGLGPQGGPDWNGEIKPGPRESGFSYSFIMAADGGPRPFASMFENGRVAGLDPHDPIEVSYRNLFYPPRTDGSGEIRSC